MTLEVQAVKCVEEKLHAGNRYPRRGKRKAHVVEWELHHGSVPEGKELHHTCFNTACVNVEHLQVVTRSEHQRLHRNGATCKNGLHEMTEDNIKWSHRGERLCLTCHKATQRRAWTKYNKKRSLRLR